MRRVIEDGKTARISGSLAAMSVVDAPGKQKSLAFAKRTNLTMESPMMAMVGTGEEGTIAGVLFIILAG